MGRSQDKVEELFLAATDVPLERRHIFLDEQCAGDKQLRDAVESLLDADEEAEEIRFLESAILAESVLPGASIPDQPQASRESPTPQPLARFEVLARHDRGGLGEVYIAFDRQLKRQVAIKQIRPKWRSHEEALQRFTREAEVTGRLEHPGIVPVYAMGEWDDGCQYYAMRFIEGQTLKQVIRDHHASFDAHSPQGHMLQLRSLLNRFVDVCNTINYAHSKKVLHRDIKPSNIMVGPYGETLVVDWGLAKLLDQAPDDSLPGDLLASGSAESGSTPTVFGRTVGTPQYMSPEQAAGQLDQIGVKTDIYLLGATLYQILTDQPPHYEDSAAKILSQVERGSITPPSIIKPETPKALEAVCTKAMAADQSQRYESVADLAADVEAWLADQPVSAYQDPLPVRLGRWGRQHRSVVAGGIVAAALVFVGSILGSTIWNRERTRQLQLERERNNKEAELVANRSQRIVELAASARMANKLSENEIRANRYSSALKILTNASDSLASESQLQDENQLLTAKAKRIGRIVDFYRLADLIQEHHVAGKDVSGMIVGATGLRSLGIWDKPDWWNHLPDQDLSPTQRDRFRWDVYHHWTMLNAMVSKVIGIKINAANDDNTAPSAMDIVRRMIQSDVGKREANAAITICDRIAMFRRSEMARWYRSSAQFRLGQSRLLKASELGAARNAADAQLLGIMCLVSAEEPGLRVFFENYRGTDPYVAARDLFQRSSSLRPDHYWTQLSLAHTHFLIAEANAHRTWRDYNQAIQTIGRCIAINPDKCIAYTDRCSMYIAQAQLLESDPQLSESERSERTAERLKLAIQDAQTATRVSNSQPWVLWQLGLALFELDQIDEAVATFQSASIRTHLPPTTRGGKFLQIADFRRLEEVEQILQRLVAKSPSNPRLIQTLASVRLDQDRNDEAMAAASQAISLPGAQSHAFAVRGMVYLREKQFNQAEHDFQKALELDASHIWAMFGAGLCDERSGRLEQSLARFHGASELATTDEQRAQCLMSAARVNVLLHRYIEATNLIVAAAKLNPSVNVSRLIRQLRQDPDDSMSEPLALARHEFLRTADRLARSNDLGFSEPAPETPQYTAPLLNGDFELASLKYWDDESGASWRNVGGYQSSAAVSDARAHNGRYSLRIRGNSIRDGAQWGITGQSFPVRPNSSCRIRCWVSAQDLQSNSLKLISANGQSLIEFPAGTYEWTKFEAEFDLPQGKDQSPVVPLRIEIRSTGNGIAWLDDLTVEVYEPRSNNNQL